jgi:hypothetical protein
MKHKKGKCRCNICEAVAKGATLEEARAQFAQWTRDKMKQYGRFAQCVSDDEDSPTRFNIHTHGLTETFQHLDFQIIVPMPEKVAHGILCNIVERLKEGERYQAGDVLEGILGNGYKCKLVEATEDDRKVLRVIIPDKRGNLDADTLIKPFDLQYADLDEPLS